MNIVEKQGIEETYPDLDGGRGGSGLLMIGRSTGRNVKSSIIQTGVRFIP